MEPHRLTTLPGGERVITERIDGVRSAAIGLWIGAGSRDEPLAKAGVSHFIEHLLFKGTRTIRRRRDRRALRHDGRRAQRRDVSRDDVVYTRVPDDHLDVAFEVMTDMVFAPSLNDIDSEREVVLEEIAMVDDNPQDLVHDLAAEAVFGEHPLGRPVIGRAEVIASISRRSLLGYHRSAYMGPNVVLAAAGNVDHNRIVAALRKRRKGTGAAAPPLLPAGPRVECAATRASLSAQEHRAVPRLPCRPRDPPRRPPALRLGLARRDPGRVGLIAPVPGDPGEARHGVLRLHVRVAVLDAGQVGIYVGTREENLRECLEVIAAELRDVGAGQSSARASSSAQRRT